MQDPMIPAYRWLEIGPKLVEALREIAEYPLVPVNGQYADLVDSMREIAQEALTLLAVRSPG